jgi:hypothetical protein
MRRNEEVHVEEAKREAEGWKRCMKKETKRGGMKREGRGA